MARALRVALVVPVIGGATCAGPRTERPSGTDPCPRADAGALLTVDTTRILMPGDVTARFSLTVHGSALGDAIATLCIEVDSTRVYADRLRTWWWWRGPGLEDPGVEDSLSPTDGDDVVRSVAEGLLSDIAFGRMERSRDPDEWLFSPYEAVSHDLKEHAYREAQGLPWHAEIPLAAADYLRHLPVDSALVRRIVDQLIRDGATTFGYWAGGEEGVSIAWWNDGKRFVNLRYQ